MNECDRHTPFALTCAHISTHTSTHTYPLTHFPNLYPFVLFSQPLPLLPLLQHTRATPYTCHNIFTPTNIGMILHSPILSGIRVLTASRLLSCWDIYPNIDRIRDVKCFVFIIHGMVRTQFLTIIRYSCNC